MKKIVAVNCSPRATWNTATLVREAARGAEVEGAEIHVIDLYKLGKISGCVSCFGCKLQPNLGRCVYRDDIAPVLDEIRDADGLILGTPNYLNEASAGFRALYERLVFQSITYKKEIQTYNQHHIPVLLIMTTNAPENTYAENGYDQLLQLYRHMLGIFVGPTRTLTSSETLQVDDYSRYDWTRFDPEAKKARHETVFQEDKRKAFEHGVQMVSGLWD